MSEFAQDTDLFLSKQRGKTDTVERCLDQRKLRKCDHVNVQIMYGETRPRSQLPPARSAPKHDEETSAFCNEVAMVDNPQATIRCNMMHHRIKKDQDQKICLKILALCITCFISSLVELSRAFSSHLGF